MKKRTRKAGRDEARREEIVAIFSEAHQTDAIPLGEPLPGKGKKYKPKRFAGSTKPKVMSINTAPAAEATAFAAGAIIEALRELSAGLGRVPRRLPLKERWTPPGVDSVYSAPAEGWRRGRAADDRRVRAAFRALFGVEPERLWEIVLERAVRDALAMRAVLPPEPLDGMPTAPTAADVLDVVKKYAMPGSLPPYLTVDAIEAAFERCTDADRGGGRGRAAAKWSVKRWIKWLDRAVARRKKTKGG